MHLIGLFMEGLKRTGLERLRRSPKRRQPRTLFRGSVFRSHSTSTTHFTANHRKRRRLCITSHHRSSLAFHASSSTSISLELV